METHSTMYMTALKLAGSMALHLKHGFSSSLFHPQLIYLDKQFYLGQSRLTIFIQSIRVFFQEQHPFYLSPNSTHICQPLDVAVFRPAKTEWCDILDMWHRESRQAENLPKTVFPLLSGKLMKRLKSQNFVSGVRACGMFPLNRHEVLKNSLV